MIATTLQRQPSKDAREIVSPSATHHQGMGGDAVALPPNLQTEAILSITTARDVQQALAQNAQYSALLDKHLESLLLESKEHIQSSQDLLRSLGQQVHLIEDEAKVLERRLKETGITAERISESVRRLDTEKDRVEKARVWTEMVSSLKASLQSLASCIRQEDFLAATQYCIRAIAIDPGVLHSNFAAMMVPTSQYPQPPPVQLEISRKTLLDIYTAKFQAATDAKDSIEATKYFKLFPLIGWKEEGVAVYREYAKSVVREKGRAITDGLTAIQKDGLKHAMLLTRLFEHLALLIDQHQSLVDQFYGAGSFAKGVMPGLQEECDRLGRRICDAWYEEKQVQRKVDEAKSYAFTYVASIGKQSKSSANRNTAAIQRGPGGFSIPGRPSTPSLGGGANANDSDAEPEVETREVDKIIGELAAIAGRWGTYRVFLGSRLISTSDAAEGSTELQVKTSQASQDANDKEPRNGKDADQAKVGELICDNSQLGKRVTSILEETYIPLESWFLRCSVEKAHRMDKTDTSSRPILSSMLDDVFYLVRMVLARSISTANIEILSGMCRNLRYIIDEDFVQALVRKMDSIWKASSQSMNVDGPRKDAASREIRSTFIVHLNVLATSAEYMTRIVAELSSEQSLSKHYIDKEISMAVSTIQGLSILIPRIRNAVRTHLELLYTTLVKPKLKQVLTDCLRETSYLLNEEDFARLEQESGNTSQLLRRFIRGWDNTFLSGNYRQLLTPDNWESFLRLAIDSVVQIWEEWAFNSRYTELGALCFDKDVRSLISFLSSQSPLGGLRDRFTRLSQISYLVNLDDDAVEEQASLEDNNNTFTASRNDDHGISASQLSPAEISKIRQRRKMA